MCTSLIRAGESIENNRPKNRNGRRPAIMCALAKDPFYILNIPVRADKGLIAEAADQQSLIYDADLCGSAMDKLLNPVRRLEAELDWFPQEDEETVRVISEAVRNRLRVPEETVSKLGDLGWINASVYDLSLMGADDWIRNIYGPVKTIIRIGELLDTYASSELLDSVNEARRRAGISEAAPVTFRKEAERKADRTADELAEIICKAPEKYQLQVMNRLATVYAQDGSAGGSRLFCVIADRFEIHTAEKYNALTKELEKAILDIINKSLFRGFRLKSFSRKLGKWGQYDGPLRTAAALRGIKRAESVTILNEILIMIRAIISTRIRMEPQDVCEYIGVVSREFASLPGADLMIKDSLKDYYELVSKLTGKSVEEVARKRERDRTREKFSYIFLTAFLVFMLFAIIAGDKPSDDTSGSSFTNDPYKQNAYGSYETVSMPPSGYVFQDTMKEEGRTVNIHIRGLDDYHSFVRISDRYCPDDTYIYTAFGADGDSNEDASDDGSIENAKLLSIMVGAGEELDVSLPPGEYCISWDYGTEWYGWTYRFTPQNGASYAPPGKNWPRMKVVLKKQPLEDGKKYKLELFPEGDDPAG